MWRDDAYLLDMLLAARKILKFTQGVTREGLLANCENYARDGHDWKVRL